MVSLSMTSAVQAAPQVSSDIPRLTHAEANRLAATELERVIALVESLAGDDWAQPTDCTEWTVRDMVAHISGALAASASFDQFKRQMVHNPYMSEMEQIDAINRVQVEDRADMTTDELLAELREIGPKGLRTRQRLPWIVRNLRAPLGVLGFAPIGYLTDIIYPRDQWMHRVDICRATGKTMQVTPEHDGRMIALVMKDVARKVNAKLNDKTVDLRLTGALEQTYRFGKQSIPDATVTLDFFEFNRLASGRLTPEAALEHVAIMGNSATGEWFIRNTEVPY